MNLGYISKNKIFILIILIFFMYLYTSSIPYSLVPKPMFNSPNINMYYFFTNLYMENANLSFKPQYIDILPRDIAIALTPRDAAQFNKKIVLQGTLITPILYGTASIFGKVLILILTPFFSLIAALCYYLLVKEIFDNKTAIITMMLLLLFPLYWYHSSILIMDVILSTLFLLIGLLYYFKLIKEQKNVYFLLSFLFLIFSALFRYENLLLLMPLPFIYIYVNKKIIKWNWSIIASIISIFVILPILILNRNLYGSYFLTGWQILFKLFILVIFLVFIYFTRFLFHLV